MSTEQSVAKDHTVHWEGDAPTSLHGNGPASFARTSRDPSMVTCRLCRSKLLEWRDERQGAISEAIWDHAIGAIEDGLSSRVRALMAIEDVHTMVHSLVERLDDAGLAVVSSPSGHAVDR